MEHITGLILIGILTLLSAIQIPLDLKTHRLSRYPTLIAMVGVTAVSAIDALANVTPNRLLTAIVLALMVCLIYYVCHLFRPQSLGFGDVLLVAPLGLAVSYAAPSDLLTWQLVAALSASVHALLIRVRSGGRHIPFGPHLLVAALLVSIQNL